MEAIIFDIPKQFFQFKIKALEVAFMGKKHNILAAKTQFVRTAKKLHSKY